MEYFLYQNHKQTHPDAGMSDLTTNYARLVTCQTNLGLFNINFGIFWLQPISMEELIEKVTGLSYLLLIWHN